MSAEIARKLQLDEGGIRVVNGPPGFTLDAPAGAGGAVLVFAKDRGELDAHGGPAVEAAGEDRLAWIAYPKAGQLGTDLNRDILAALMSERGLRGVRQVAIDETWSALRFRPR